MPVHRVGAVTRPREQQRNEQRRKEVSEEAIRASRGARESCVCVTSRLGGAPHSRSYQRGIVMRQQGPRYVSLLGTLTLLLITASVLVGLPSTAAAKPHFRIVTLSTRPDTVSGGNVLVRIDVPRDMEFNAVKVLLNGHDVTSAFQPDASGGVPMGRGGGTLPRAKTPPPRGAGARGR